MQFVLERGLQTQYYNFVFSIDSRFFDEEFAARKTCDVAAWVDGKCPRLGGIEVNPLYTPEQAGENLEQMFTRAHYVNAIENLPDRAGLTFDQFLEQLRGSHPPPWTLYRTLRSDSQALVKDPVEFDASRGTIHFVAVAWDLEGIHTPYRPAGAWSFRLVKNSEGVDELYVEIYDPYVYSVNDQRVSHDLYIGYVFNAALLLMDTSGQQGIFTLHALENLSPKIAEVDLLRSWMAPIADWYGDGLIEGIVVPYPPG